MYNRFESGRFQGGDTSTSNEIASKFGTVKKAARIAAIGTLLTFGSPMQEASAVPSQPIPEPKGRCRIIEPIENIVSRRLNKTWEVVEEAVEKKSPAPLREIIETNIFEIETFSIERPC